VLKKKFDAMKLKYPVFAFQKGNSMIYVFLKEYALKSTSKRFLNNGGFKGDTIVDSMGNVFKIKNAQMVKYRGLGGFNPLLKGRQILVDFEYENEVSSMSLSDFKKDIVKRIAQNSNYWQASGDVSDLQTAVEECFSFEEIANLLK
jgi:hypothetical protein